MFAMALGWLVRALASTWRVVQAEWPVPGPCVVAFWHGDQLPLVALHRGIGVVGLVSLSADGEVLTGVLRALGYDVIRGSTSRGGVGALRAAARALRAGKRPALAVDGPRGPCGVEQPGARALSEQAHVPVVFVTVSAPGWRASSWDRFLVPWPFARVHIQYEVRPPPEATPLAAGPGSAPSSKGP